MKPLIVLLLLILSCNAVNNSYAQRHTIVSQVSADSMLQTLKEFTGAAPIYLNGRQDTITTRRIYTTGNRLASEYILQRMTSYGLAAELLHYRGDLARFGWSLSFTGLGRVPTGSLLWLCSDWGEIFSSSDSGGTWVSRLRSAVPDTDRLDWIAPFNSTSIAAMGKTGALATSTDRGVTWVRRASGLSHILHFAASNSGTFLALAPTGEIRRSTDLGTNWSSSPVDTSCVWARIGFLDPNHALAAGNEKSSGLGRLYESTDAGLSWHRLTVPGVGGGFTTLCVGDSVRVWLAGEKGACYHTNSGGANWTLKPFADSTETAKTLVFADSLNGWILAASGILYRTSTGGKQWTMAHTFGAPVTLNDFCFIDSVHGVAVGGEISSERTRDGGLTWQDETVPLPADVIASVRGTQRPGLTLLVTAHSDCEARDGNIWLTAPGADDDGSGVGALIELARIFAKSPLPCTVKFIAMPDEETMNMGTRASAAKLLAGSDTMKLLLDFDMVGNDSTYPRAVTNYYTSDSLGIRSRDLLKRVISREGLSLSVAEWADAVPSNGVGFFFAKVPLAGLSEGAGWGSRINRQYHTQGDVWSTLNPAYYANVVRAGAGLLYELAGYLVTTDVPQRPTGHVSGCYALAQNYPNPFNPATTIRYSVPERSLVVLKVYDMLGREVATLVNGWVTPGVHEAAFQARNLGSGVYFCRMSAGTFTATRTLHLVK